MLMLKKLLVPTLVLTLAGLLSSGCHDDSGNGTNHPVGPDAATDTAVPTGDAAAIDADAADASDAEVSDATATDSADATGN
jgi:hypothetical protein